MRTHLLFSAVLAVASVFVPMSANATLVSVAAAGQGSCEDKRDPGNNSSLEMTCSNYRIDNPQSDTSVGRDQVIVPEEDGGGSYLSIRRNWFAFEVPDAIRTMTGSSPTAPRSPHFKGATLSIWSESGFVDVSAFRLYAYDNGDANGVLDEATFVAVNNPVVIPNLACTSGASVLCLNPYESFDRMFNLPALGGGGVPFSFLTRSEGGGVWYDFDVSSALDLLWDASGSGSSFIFSGVGDEANDGTQIFGQSGSPYRAAELTLLVPEPGSMVLVLAGLAGLAGMRRRHG